VAWITAAKASFQPQEIARLRIVGIAMKTSFGERRDDAEDGRRDARQ
jgi:hypothetical protein